METILTKQCLSLTGVLARGYGYYLQRRGKRFFAVRMRLNVPPDGHWRFIVLCAELAQLKLYFSDIKVTRAEIAHAIFEAGKGDRVRWKNVNRILNAADVLQLKQEFAL